MIRPPCGSCAFIVATTSRAHRKAPVRLTATVDNHPRSGQIDPADRAERARIVDQKVHPPPLAARRREQVGHRRRIGDVVGTTSAASVPSAVSSSARPPPGGARSTRVEQRPRDHPPIPDPARHHRHVACHGTAP